MAETEMRKRGRPRKSEIHETLGDYTYEPPKTMDHSTKCRPHGRDYGEVDIERCWNEAREWAMLHPSPKPKKAPTTKKAPMVDVSGPITRIVGASNICTGTDRMRIRDTQDYSDDEPDMKSVMELAEKHPELRTFFIALGRYMENTREYSIRLKCALDRFADGKTTFRDGLIVQRSCDAMCEDFQRLRKAIKKAKE